MWSRAVNLKVCVDLSTTKFLRAFQLHVFEFGVPQYCFSDLGTQLVAGGNIILDFLKDPMTQNYFQENNVKPMSFDHYFKGRSELGSLVESMVKQTKRLIYGSVKKQVLSMRDFEFHVCQVIHVINRHPIAFQESLRESTDPDLPEVITPEILLKGQQLVSLNVIPQLNIDDIEDWVPAGVSLIKQRFSKLQRARKELIKIYNEEFLKTLIHQAMDKTDRYKPTLHHSVNPGDIVLIKE